jgi:hypothetical protein
MIVEGIASANKCSGARSRPIRLSIPNRVVYSSHVYVSRGNAEFDRNETDSEHRHGAAGGQSA